MNTVHFYNPDTKIITEMPMAELAPGCIACQIEGVEGIVYTQAAKLKPNPAYAHPPFPDEYNEVFEEFSRIFKDVCPRTPEEWADGFRRDANPDKEIDIWANIAGGYNHLTEDGSLSPAARKDYFRLVLACFISGADAALQTVKLEELSLEQGEAAIAKLKRGRE